MASQYFIQETTTVRSRPSPTFALIYEVKRERGNPPPLTRSTGCNIVVLLAIHFAILLIAPRAFCSLHRPQDAVTNAHPPYSIKDGTGMIGVALLLLIAISYLLATGDWHLVSGIWHLDIKLFFKKLLTTTKINIIILHIFSKCDEGITCFWFDVPESWRLVQVSALQKLGLVPEQSSPTDSSCKELRQPRYHGYRLY